MRCQALTSLRNTWRLHGLSNGDRIGAGRKNTDPHRAAIGSQDSALLIIDPCPEEFLAAAQKRPCIPGCLHANNVRSQQAVKDGVAPMLRDEFECRGIWKGDMCKVETGRIREYLPKQRGKRIE